MKYRPDIDGLRAIAVVPVVLYHLDKQAVSGGFVGVDIFFVISGYLITSILLGELEATRFSLVRFYERRVRRILPALLAMLAGVLAAGYAFLLPSEFVELSRSAVATLFFASNFYFNDEGDYFRHAADSAPLLHTWSLGVEEQFYIVFPLCLALAWRFARERLATAIGILALASFALGVWGVQAHPKAAFYLTPFRFWELALGALLAMGRFPRLERRSVREAAGAAGLALILASVFAFSSSTTFPGLAALAPCLGAALLLYAGAGGDSLARRLLAFRPVAFVGLISYPLYLWHWPIIAFFRIVSEREPTMLDSAAIFGASVGLATLSWRFVEMPVRRGGAMAPASRLFAAVGGGAALCLAAALSILLAGGLPSRLPAPAARNLEIAKLETVEKQACFERRRNSPRPEPCQMGPEDGRNPRVLVMGDSHAAALAPGLAERAGAHGERIAVRARELCPPLLGTTTIFRSRDEGCRQINAEALDYVRRHDIRHIVLVARWNLYTQGWTGGGASDVFLDDGASRAHSYRENAGTISRRLAETVRQFTADGRDVWLVLQAPANFFHVPNELARAALVPALRREARGMSLPEHLGRSKPMLDVVAALPADPRLHIVDPAGRLCDRAACRLTNAAGVALYTDSDHLSPAGAREVADLLDGIFSAKALSAAIGQAAPLAAR